jgi:hypothetical protein
MGGSLLRVPPPTTTTGVESSATSSPARRLLPPFALDVPARLSVLSLLWLLAADTGRDDDRSCSVAVDAIGECCSAAVDVAVPTPSTPSLLPPPPPPSPPFGGAFGGSGGRAGGFREPAAALAAPARLAAPTARAEPRCADGGSSSRGDTPTSLLNSNGCSSSVLSSSAFAITDDMRCMSAAMSILALGRAAYGRIAHGQRTQMM